MSLKVEFIKQPFKKALPHSSCLHQCLCAVRAFIRPLRHFSSYPIEIGSLCFYPHTVHVWLRPYLLPAHILDSYSPSVVLSFVPTTAAFASKAAVAALLRASMLTGMGHSFLLSRMGLLESTPIGWLLLLFFLILLLSLLGQSNWQETNLNLWLLLHLPVFHTCWRCEASVHVLLVCCLGTSLRSLLQLIFSF